MYGARFSTEICTRGCHWIPPCLLEVNMCVTNGIPLGCPLLLPVGTINSVQTLKAKLKRDTTTRSLGYQSLWLNGFPKRLQINELVELEGPDQVIVTVSTRPQCLKMNLLSLLNLKF